MTETANSKYAQLASIIMLVVIAALVGTLEFSLVILAGDIAMIAVVIPLEQRTRTIMRKRESKELLLSESPLDWLKYSMTLFLISLVTSIGYAVFQSSDVVVSIPPINDMLLAFSIGFFLFGLFYIIRIGYFLIDPSSKGNIMAGKVIRTTLKIGIRVAFLAFVAFAQFTNGLLLVDIIRGAIVRTAYPTLITGLFAFTLIASFVAMIPLIWAILTRLTDQIRRKDWVVLAFFVSPWIMLFTLAFLNLFGIKL